jgi:hypothetical protein
MNNSFSNFTKRDQLTFDDLIKNMPDDINIHNAAQSLTLANNGYVFKDCIGIKEIEGMKALINANKAKQTSLYGQQRIVFKII